MQMLLKYGAKINEEDEYGCTALHETASYGQGENVAAVAESWSEHAATRGDSLWDGPYGRSNLAKLLRHAGGLE